MRRLVFLRGLGSGTQFHDNSGFDEIAEANGFIVV